MTTEGGSVSEQEKRIRQALVRASPEVRHDVEQALAALLESHRQEVEGLKEVCASRARDVFKANDERDAQRVRAEQAEREREVATQVAEKAAVKAQEYMRERDEASASIAALEELAAAAELSCEAARKERDKVRAEVERLRKQREEDAVTVRTAIDERMAAEADNASLLIQFEEWSMKVAQQSGTATGLTKWKLEQLAADLLRVVMNMRGHVRGARHPGAALLREVEALRRVLDCARTVVDLSLPTAAADDALERAVREADKARGTHA